MKSIIALQDEYIAKVSRYDPRGYTYSTLVTKAAKKLRFALEDLGFNDHDARVLVAEAHDVVEHNRSLAAA